jgi:F-type H+-transporting ATPase subunit delta
MAQKHDPSLIALRYVTALFELAHSAKKTDEVAKELAALALLVKTSPEFAALCHSPVITRQTKSVAIATLVSTLKLSKLVGQFLALLTQNQRLALLPQIAESFAARLRSERGEAIAQIQTATTLSESLQKELSTLLSRFSGKKVSLSVQQEPEILGGVRIHLGGTMIDASLAGKLARLKDALSSSGRDTA